MTLEEILSLNDTDIRKALIICNLNPPASFLRRHITWAIQKNDPELRAKLEQQMTRNLTNAKVRL